MSGVGARQSEFVNKPSQYCSLDTGQRLKPCDQNPSELGGGGSEARLEQDQSRARTRLEQGLGQWWGRNRIRIRLKAKRMRYAARQQEGSWAGSAVA